ncbi:MAG: nuclear transport factor 2 family protein [Eudoraea sp.]|nr:nuclear transport factor 2 family protein [Eudoraea sp.]
MRKLFILSALSLMLGSINACKTTYKEINIAEYTEENHPVKELFLSSIEAFNQGNLQLFVANFAPDVKMYGTDGNYFGQTALERRFESLFKQFPKMKMDIPVLTLEVLSEDVVLVNFEWKLYPMGQGPAFSGIGSGVYQYSDEKWMEILEVETVTAVDEALKQ